MTVVSIAIISVFGLYLYGQYETTKREVCEVESSSVIYLALDESLSFDEEKYQIEDENIVSVDVIHMSSMYRIFTVHLY